MLITFQPLHSEAFRWNKPGQGRHGEPIPDPECSVYLGTTSLFPGCSTECFWVSEDQLQIIPSTEDERLCIWNHPIFEDDPDFKLTLHQPHPDSPDNVDFGMNTPFTDSAQPAADGTPQRHGSLLPHLPAYAPTPPELVLTHPKSVVEMAEIRVSLDGFIWSYPETDDEESTPLTSDSFGLVLLPTDCSSVVPGDGGKGVLSGAAEFQFTVSLSFGHPLLKCGMEDIDPEQDCSGELEFKIFGRELGETDADAWVEVAGTKIDPVEAQDEPGKTVSFSLPAETAAQTELLFRAELQEGLYGDRLAFEQSETETLKLVPQPCRELERAETPFPPRVTGVQVVIRLRGVTLNPEFGHIARVDSGAGGEEEHPDQAFLDTVQSTLLQLLGVDPQTLHTVFRDFEVRRDPDTNLVDGAVLVEFVITPEGMDALGVEDFESILDLLEEAISEGEEFDDLLQTTLASPTILLVDREYFETVLQLPPSSGDDGNDGLAGWAVSFDSSCLEWCC